MKFAFLKKQLLTIQKLSADDLARNIDFKVKLINQLAKITLEDVIKWEEMENGELMIKGESAPNAESSKHGTTSM